MKNSKEQPQPSPLRCVRCGIETICLRYKGSIKFCPTGSTPLAIGGQTRVAFPQITEEHVLKYFKENSISIGYKQYNINYTNGEYGKTDKGILLGQRIDERTIVYKTFITEEMAKGKQIEISDILNKKLNSLVFDELGNRHLVA